MLNGRPSVYEQTIEAIRHDRRIGERMYSVNERLVAKQIDSYGLCLYEFEVGTFLWSRGITVPRMDYFFLVPPENKFYGSSWVIIMEKVDGRPIGYHLQDEELCEALEQYREQIRQVLNLGIAPRDISFRNTLFDRSHRKLYLLDFESWENLDCSYNNNPEDILSRLEKGIRSFLSGC